MIKVLFLSIVSVISGSAQAQADATATASTATATGVQPQAAAPDTQEKEDRYPALKERANDLRTRWQALDEEVFTKQLPKITDNCSPKIRPLINKVKSAMESYVQAYSEYTSVYAEDMARQVKALKNTVAGQQSELKESSMLLAEAQKDYDETRRRRDLLAQGGDANADAVKEADALLSRMNDSQQTMKKIKADLEDMQNQGQSTEAAVVIKEQTIGQLKREITTLLSQYRTYYEKRSETYEYRCIDTTPHPPAPPPGIIDFGTDKVNK